MKKFALICALGTAGAFAFGQDCCGDNDKVVTKKQQAVNGQESCCKSTEAKVVAKGSEGCCNAKGEVAKYKIYVVGEGYRFFGCEGSAAKTYMNLLASTKKAGTIQKVVSKINI